MNSLASRNGAVKATLAPETELLAAGYKPGIPPALTMASRDVDRDNCRRMRCGECHRKGLIYRPFHRGASYRILASCAHCSFTEEI